jgi:superfamily II DNA helicase RecQ
MELGVDISALNVVYMRNVPPTPANYAQRSGRAGRSGQAALVLTYCSSQSPHDQYFFRDPRAMVHGEVRRRCSISPTVTSSRATCRRSGWRAPGSARSVHRRAARA